MKINIKWILIVIVVLILATSVYAAFTDESRIFGVQKTGDSGDSVIPTSTKKLLPINVSAHGMKKWTTNIIGNRINVSDIYFDGKMKHLIINPTRIGIVHIGNISSTVLDDPREVYVSNDVAYVVTSSSNALSTFNVTDPRYIVLMDSITGTGAPNFLSFARDVHVSNDVAYVVTQDDDALSTFNVTNATNITHMGNISGAGDPNFLDRADGIFVSNDVAYVVSTGDDALSTFNVTNATNITHMSNIS